MTSAANIFLARSAMEALAFALVALSLVGLKLHRSTVLFVGCFGLGGLVPARFDASPD